MNENILNDDFQGETGDLALTRSGVVAQKKSKKSLAEALDIITAHRIAGGSFTNAQMDICTEVIITMLPQEEREIFREISEQNDNYPLWIVLLAQWRRSKENAECFALLVDPEWTAKAEEK